MLPGLITAEQKALILSVGTHRAKRALTPCEVAALYQKALLSGASKAQCSEETQLGATWIARFLSLLRLDPAVRHLVDWGQTDESVAFTAAVEIARIPREHHEYLFRKVLESTLHSKETQQIVQIYLRSRRPIEECAEDVLKLRPVTTHQVMFIGAITQSNLKLLLRAKTQAERDLLLRKVIVDTGPGLENCHYKLGTEKFAVIATNAEAQLFKSRFKDFEAEIGNLLLSTLSQNE